MRRAFSILLVLFFTLGPLTAALPASDDARLPACCRRNGAHRCAMSAQMMAAMRAWAQKDTTPGFSAPMTCPMYPGTVATLMAPADAVMASPLSLPVLLARAHAPAAGHVATIEYPILPHAGRGPPADLLS